MEEEGISGPWRATRLWNDIIRNFRSGMPIKKHKKNLRTYDNCFSSTEAIDWLQKDLQNNPNFGTDVTKEQTIQLLKKLHRAGIIENVKEDLTDNEFKISGELYKFSNKSPVRNIRTPGKENKKPSADTGNKNLSTDKYEQVVKPERDKSASRKAKEEMKRQLNLSYFQALPSNSLIMLDTDDTWRKVYVTHLSRVMSIRHTDRLDYAGQLDMEYVMHNMTKVSPKGIVQVDDKSEDLPHWVLSAMKCLANWPKQLRTPNGEESCLPAYTGFQNDVFNVVRDYFVSLQYPLTTCTLYEFLVEGYQKAEGKLPPPIAPKPIMIRTNPTCTSHPVSANKQSSRAYTQTNIDVPLQPPAHEEQFFTMTDSIDDFAMLTNKERVAKIKQTFQVLPPLATSSLQTSNNTSSSLSPHSTFDATSPNSLSSSSFSSTTAAINQFLPPNTCFETAFVDQSPITRIVPQKEHEVLHIRKSWSGRSLIPIVSASDSRSTSTQTNVEDIAVKQNSLKRIPRWKRTSRFRKSIAVMEHQKNTVLSRDNRDVRGITNPAFSEGGITNYGFCETPADSCMSMNPRGRVHTFQSQVELEIDKYNNNMKGFSSVDNLLDREKEFEQEFMLKYRQVSGDLRASCDLVQTSRLQADANKVCHDSRQLIHSKTVRNEKRKRRTRYHHRAYSEDRYGGYATDSEILYHAGSTRNLNSINDGYCKMNRSLDTSPIAHKTTDNVMQALAPLAVDETTEISPVPFVRNNKYNNSYRLATNQPATPVGKSGLPRTSTKLSLQQKVNGDQLYSKNARIAEARDPVVHVNTHQHNYYSSTDSAYKSVPYKTSSTWSQFVEAGVTNTGQDFKRNVSSRLSRCSETTVDSGRYSDVSRASTAHKSRGLYVLPPQVKCCDDQVNAPVQTALTAQTLPADLLFEKLRQLPKQPGKVEENSIEIFKLLTLLIPPCNRRKLQLLIKFIRKVSLNHELVLDSQISNRELSINTFTPVILRPSDPNTTVPAVDKKIINLFLDKYEEIWTPPETLRREVEDKVYQGLVNRRLEAGEDPYPITYCQQVTRQQYEMSKLTGAQSALMQLLDAIITQSNLTDKEKAKKLKKFKEAYPQLWRRRFPTHESEPTILSVAATKLNKFSSLTRIKNRIRM